MKKREKDKYNDIELYKEKKILLPDENIQNNLNEKKNSEASENLIIPKEYSFEPNKIKEYDLKIKNKNENVENNDKDEKEDINILIKNILNNDILNETKKEDLNKLILKIKSTDINKIINNNNKLDIVFDLSNTCVFDYIINEEKYKNF